MKCTILAMLTWLMLSLWACGSSRKLESRTEAVSIEEAVEKTARSSDIRDYLMSEIRSSLIGISFNHTVYDTAKIRSPTNPQRILSKTTGVLTISNGTVKDTKDSHREGVTFGEHFNISVSDSTGVDVTSIRKETEIPKRIGDTFVWALVATGLILGYLVLLRYGGPDKH